MEDRNGRCCCAQQGPAGVKIPRPHPTDPACRAPDVYDTSFRIAADYEAMLRYLVKGQIKLAYIPRVLVKMRVGGESNRSIGRILCKSQEDYRAMRRHGVGGIGTLAAKNIRKIGQFFYKDRTVY